MSVANKPDMPSHAIDAASAWVGHEMAARPSEWLETLTADDIEDLESASAYFLELNSDLKDIDRHNFPLRHFDNHLERLRHKLLHGVGVEVLRGLVASKYSREFLSVMFCGVGAYIGSARSQNSAGDLLGVVQNTGANAADTNTRIYQTSARQTFHTDSADVVGLLCLRAAKKGGLSLLVSATTIYNRMRRDCAELLALLFDPIATDRRGEIPEGAKPYMEIPPLSWHAAQLTVFYQRQYIDSAQRFQGAMKLTREHIAALNKFDQLANDPELYFSMQLEPGDMQFVYNHTQLHDRTGFEDWTEEGKQRLLLRLWLSVPGDRPLPPCFRERYGSIEIGNRGGIITRST
jgi:hypothetical protein